MLMFCVLVDIEVFAKGAFGDEASESDISLGDFFVDIGLALPRDTIESNIYESSSFQV